VEDEPLPAPPETTAELAWASEEGALERWAAFLDGPIDDYDEARDRPDLDGTSRLSIALKLGAVHPRTLLADLDRVAPRRGRAAQRSLKRFQAELAWREFYADVLLHHPSSAWRDYGDQLRGLVHDEPGALFDAWREGRTGFPFVDAGMRQLLAEGWMHNRVRMVTASFLTKDLHVWWPHGARHFMEHLADGDLASNSHGWQWTAGTGTDAAPYFRVFNPVLQGQRYDPAGDYVRRWVPELRHVPGAAVHEPWKVPDGLEHGYPERILDHAAERREALDRLAAISG
ncbi:deoxyribodipyrimidine photo-lyase, partial [Agrococcus sp. HG114]|uniref:cryptochrome/photolyase family protein n=1 Tax=Agrococcus sp. HG114 TaxID=2969757 RepID=UPI00215A3828